MSKYEVFLKKKTIKDLKHIGRIYYRQLKHRIEKLADNPLPRDAIKLSEAESIFRIRQGNYRIIYTIDFKKHIVRILAVEHRKESYRNI